MFERSFIFEAGQHFASCHAATVVELSSGDLLSAWFAGSHEGHPDVGIWLSRFDGARWREPIEVVSVPGVPLWNPVLFRDRAGAVWLFYKAAPTIPAWTGAYLRSEDDGESWSVPCYLPAGLLGPIKNKPLTLSGGEILSPTSTEAWMSWASWVEISADGGQTWSKHGPIVAPDGQAVVRPKAGDAAVSAGWNADAGELLLPRHTHGLIQPTAWEYRPGCIKMLMRATGDIGAVCAAVSEDGGRTWSPSWRTDVPNPNSGLDAVRLADGRVVLACNPVSHGRTPLSLLMSADNGETWPWRLDLETAPGEYSYPSIIQGGDGLIHCVYTYRRETISHVLLDVSAIAS